MLSIHKINGNKYIYCRIFINKTIKWFYVAPGEVLSLAQIKALTNKINVYVLKKQTTRKHKIDLRSYTHVYNNLCIDAIKKNMLIFK